MRRMITGMVAALTLFCFASNAMAQRDARDAADRGTRIDTDAFRNDMAQDRLKVPGHPLWVAPAPAPPPAAPKRKRTEKKQQQ